MEKSSPRLCSVTLRVPNTKIDGLKNFYTKVLGMDHVLFRGPEGNTDSFVISQHHPKYLECLRQHNSIDLKFISKPSLGQYHASKELFLRKWKSQFGIMHLFNVSTTTFTRWNHFKFSHYIPQIVG